MARSRKTKDQKRAAQPGDAYEPPAAGAVPDFPPADEAAAPPPAADPRPAYDPDDPNKLRTVVSAPFRGKHGGVLHLVDDGNARGVGIRIAYDDPAARPADDEKAVLKAPKGNYRGFEFRGEMGKQWRKAVGRDAPAPVAVAVRMDAEERFDTLHAKLNHAERVEQERQPADEPADKTPGR